MSARRWGQLGEVVALLALLASLGLLASGLCGCGGATAEQRTTYAIEQARCLAAERAIVDEPCGELEHDECERRDRDALTAERARCDAALRAIYGGP